MRPTCNFEEVGRVCGRHKFDRGLKVNTYINRNKSQGEIRKNHPHLCLIPDITKFSPLGDYNDISDG